MPLMDQTATVGSNESTLKTKETDLFVWMAPARPFKRRNREFWVTVIAISAIVGLVLFVVEGFMPVALVVSLVFLFYVMNTVEPESIEYKITNFGVKVAGNLTQFEVLTRFWFTRRLDNELLVFETTIIPGRLEMVINREQKNNIREALLKYLPEEEAPPSSLDKAANWFSKKIPGNNV